MGTWRADTELVRDSNNELEGSIWTVCAGVKKLDEVSITLLQGRSYPGQQRRTPVVPQVEEYMKLPQISSSAKSP